MREFPSEGILEAWRAARPELRDVPLTHTTTGTVAMARAAMVRDQAAIVMLDPPTHRVLIEADNAIYIFTHEEWYGEKR